MIVFFQKPLIFLDKFCYLNKHVNDAGVMAPAPANTPAKKVRWRHRGASKNARWRHYGASKIDSLVSFFGVVIVFPFPFLGLAFRLSASARPIAAENCNREFPAGILGCVSRFSVSYRPIRLLPRIFQHGASSQLGVTSMVQAANSV